MTIEKFLQEKETDKSFPVSYEGRADWIISRLKDPFDTRYSLYPYQKRWLFDQSRFKIILKARQIGYSFTIALEALMECFLLGNNCLVVSASQLQSDEVMEKLKEHYWALKKLFPYLKEGGDSKSGLKINFLKKDGTLSKSYKKIVSLPENPRTVQGFTGTIFLDEFAHQEKAEKMYKAIVPSITRSASFKLRVISTPQGKKGKFYELWSKDNSFSKHRTDIYEAKSEGYCVDIDELKNTFTTDEFAQSYECAFLDANYSYFPLDLIISAESERLRFWDRKQRGVFYLGIDIGRKKDLTAIFLLEKIEETVYQRDLIILKNKEFSKQFKVISSLIADYNIRVCAIDSTGIGMQIAEEIRKKFGQRIEPVHFTNDIKEKLVTDLRISFEDETVKIIPDKLLRDEIHSIQRSVTAAGNIRYEGSSKDGHADRFWALALCNYAANLKKYPKIEYFTSGARRVFTTGGRVFRKGAVHG